MTTIHPHNYIQNYEAGVAALKDRPNDRQLQHQIVLALARAGALTFAISEYERFGLSDIKNDEDIMALNGRLSKDLYLRSSGREALKYANDAAQKYEAAFQTSLGYYSGVNSATMALMADLPKERVMARIEAIEALLPVSQETTPTDHYFVEATRAECFLLRGERDKAVAALHGAIDFDPLNYAAHASTLKQFMMIATKREDAVGWLSGFRPPRPLHYAGHIRLNLTESEEAEMRITISDALQQKDVGFGFGALAAGGDILFAEGLLEQGAELHIILPCEPDLFKCESVMPFGQGWEQRFDDCFSQASSVRILTQDADWPDKKLNRLSGLSAMGKSILKGQSLSVEPLQILILTETDSPSYTATHAQDWADNAFSQFRVSAGVIRPITLPPSSSDMAISVSLKSDNQSQLETYETLEAALASATLIKRGRKSAQIALHLNIEGETTDEILDQLLQGGAPQSVLATEAFATVLAAVAADKYKITYAGQIEQKSERRLRCYTIQPLIY